MLTIRECERQGSENSRLRVSKPRVLDGLRSTFQTIPWLAWLPT